MASLEYLRVTFRNVPATERRRVCQQLEKYCAQDTEGMVWIVNALALFPLRVDGNSAFQYSARSARPTFSLTLLGLPLDVKQ